MSKTHYNRWLWVILALALIIRVGYVYVQLNQNFFHVATFAPDSERYVNLAKYLIARGMYSYEGRELTANDTPGFPLFLTGLRLTVGPSLMAIYISQVFISVATVLMVFLIAQHFFSYQAGLFASFLATIYPLGFLFVATPLTETLYAFLLTAFLAMFINIRESRLWAFAAGIVGGMTILTRPVASGFIGLACLFLALKQKSRILGLLSLAGLLLIIAPWVIRNALVFGEFIPLSTASGYQVYGGNAPDSTGGSGGHMSAGVDFSHPPDQPPGVSDNEWSKKLTVMGLNAYLHDPMLFFERLPSKIWNMWRPTWADASLKNWVAIGGIYIFIWLLALFCLVSPNCRAPLLWWFILYHLAVHAVIFGIVRYRIPVEPALIALAGGGAACLWKKIRPGSLPAKAGT